MTNKIPIPIQEIYIPEGCKLIIIDKDNNIIREISQFEHEKDNLLNLLIHYPK